MAYNTPKKLYVIYDRENHEYLQKFTDIRTPFNFGEFCTCHLFEDRIEANSCVGFGQEVLEIEITKWSCKEILDV